MPDRSESTRVVALLEADPDLSVDLSGSELAQAQRHAVARVIGLSPPRWDPQELVAHARPAWLGLFVLDGLLLRRVTVGNRSACELFGAGEVVRPWDTDGSHEPLVISVDWTVLEPTHLALLDTAFMMRIGRWPALTSRIVSRLAQRGRHLTLTHAITHLPRADSRLLILFWLLAERWGRVGRDGVRVTLPLSHEVLAMLVGVHRPTVTTALRRLGEDGLLVREGSGRWLMTKAAIAALEHPETLAGTGTARRSRTAAGDPPVVAEDPPVVA